jgi:hypothetical protein
MMSMTQDTSSRGRQFLLSGVTIHILGICVVVYANHR